MAKYEPESRGYVRSASRCWRAVAAHAFKNREFSSSRSQAGKNGLSTFMRQARTWWAQLFRPMVKTWHSDVVLVTSPLTSVSRLYRVAKHGRSHHCGPIWGYPHGQRTVKRSSLHRTTKEYRLCGKCR